MQCSKEKRNYLSYFRRKSNSRARQKILLVLWILLTVFHISTENIYFLLSFRKKCGLRTTKEITVRNLSKKLVEFIEALKKSDFATFW